MIKGSQQYIAVNPLASKNGTGMSIAGDFVVSVFGECAEGKTINHLFRKLNDSGLPAVIKVLLRIALCNVLPLAYPKILFTSHHAPLWRTGYHGFVLHDIICLRYPDQHPLQTVYFKLLLARLVESASFMILISNWTQSDSESYLGKKLKTPTRVIPSVCQQLGRAVGEPNWIDRRSSRTLFFLGGKYTHKNLDCVLSALLILKKDYNLSFNLIAHGIDPSLWWREHGGLGEYPLKDSVTWTEYASVEEVSKAYSEATAFVYPSLYEGMGLPPLEAFSMGCPVLANDIPAVRETCGNSVCYFDGGNPESLANLLFLLDSGKLDLEIAQKMEKVPGILSRFSEATVSKIWLRLLNDLNEAHDRDNYSHL